MGIHRLIMTLLTRDKLPLKDIKEFRYVVKHDEQVTIAGLKESKNVHKTIQKVQRHTDINGSGLAGLCLGNKVRSIER